VDGARSGAASPDALADAKRPIGETSEFKHNLRWLQRQANKEGICLLSFVSYVVDPVAA
jgi:hypothetical protein